MAIKKARGITTGKGTPNRLEGQNGDITVRSSRKGLKLYVKEANKWHSIDLDIDSRQIALTVNSLEKSVKKLLTKTNNIPVATKILLRQSGGSAAVGIKNDAGNIAFGNGDGNVSLESNGSHNLILQTGNSTTGKITITDGNNVDIDIAPAGTGKVGITSDLNLAVGKKYKINGSDLAASDIGATTVGQNILTLSNPGAVRFLRLNADNSVTAQSDTDFKTALTLNNVTDESKNTMFTDPTFTGSGTTAIEGAAISLGAAGTAGIDMFGVSLASVSAHTDLVTIKQTLNADSTETAYDHYVFKMNVRTLDTTEFRDVYLMDLQAGTNDNATTDNTSRFSVKEDGSVACGEITAGAVIWQSFPFYISLGTHSRYYYIDVDDTANSFRRWDDYDTAPTGFNYRDVAGQFVVPEDCTLKAMHGVIQNGSSTNDPTVYVYHGTVTEAASDTTLASAGSVVVGITTLRVPYKFSKTDFDVDLSAGDIVVPMIKHSDTGGTRTFQGSLTLKFVTR